MPICEICCPRGLISEEERHRIISKLSTILIEAEGLPDNQISKSICQISFSELDYVYIGGTQSSSGKIIIKIYAFYDAYTEAIKADTYSKITKLFIDNNKETSRQCGRNIWCIVVPIEQANFAVGGIPVSLEITKKIVWGTATS